MNLPICLTRREMLRQSSTGFGMLALSALMADRSYAGLATSTALPRPHHRPRAKHVIFCFMSGGVSHVDTFDPKPRLAKEAGKPMPLKIERTQFNDNGNIMPSPWAFRRSGESGIPVSDLFPHVATVADELAVVRSMTSTANEHAQGNYCMHTGVPIMGFPSAGAWTTYGLGTENHNLPGFVVLQSGKAVAPIGGVGLFSNGFLPAQHQGSILKADAEEAVRNITPGRTDRVQRRQLDLIREIDAGFLADGKNAQVEAAIRNYETAYRMQTAVPEVCDISDESPETLELYAVNSKVPHQAGYGRQCLLARRLVERGVRFIELSCLTNRKGRGANPWDQHQRLKEDHTGMAFQVDQPIAALIKDLRRRGLLDDTLVIWAGEFGRTPFSQGKDGRDHNPFGFSIWMAGGGVKGGTIYGATDEYGYHVVENKCTVYDLWATVLHLLGVDHEQLTYRYGGRDFRLTDVHGQVIDGIVA